jgi:hypothetical protein
MGLLAAAFYGVTITVPEHVTSARFAGISIWEYLLLAVVLAALLLGFIARRVRRRRGTASDPPDDWWRLPVSWDRCPQSPYLPPGSARRSDRPLS